jgi:outer membrane murein-binding lipoprotein Lpp
MKRIAVVLAVALLATGAGTAAAGTTKQQRSDTAAVIKDLGAQVKALQSSVKKLQSQVKTLQKNQKGDETAINLAFISEACLTALTADAFQGTWAYVDQLMTAQGKPVVFGPQSVVNDYGACQLLQSAAIVHTIGQPPTVTSFAALITWIHG